MQVASARADLRQSRKRFHPAARSGPDRGHRRSRRVRT
jgi:hypothetical protein